MPSRGWSGALACGSSCSSRTRPGRPANRCLLALMRALVACAFRELFLVLRRTSDRVEELGLVADGDRRVALGRAVVGVAIGAAQQVDHLALVALNEHALVLDHVPLGVEGDYVGDAERLAGDH